jgi:S-adenosylmethionine hydrolase
MKIKHLVVITDCIDIAANELRASIINEIGDNKDIQIEPFIPVYRFSAINCNFALRLMADIYPSGTLFSVIFNPLKERPKSFIGKTEKKDFIFMGRNTGAFDWLTRDFGCKELYDASKLFTDLNKQFLSFSGKLVTAPTIAKIAQGENIKNLGISISYEEIARLNIVDYTIVHIDNFGIMKFTGNLDNMKENDYYEIEVNKINIKAIVCNRMMSQETGSWVIFPGSSFGLLELGKVREHGAFLIGAKIGDVIKFKKIS